MCKPGQEGTLSIRRKGMALEVKEVRTLEGNLEDLVGSSEGEKGGDRLPLLHEEGEENPRVFVGGGGGRPEGGGELSTSDEGENSTTCQKKKEGFKDERGRTAERK